MTGTARWALPLLEAGQAQKEMGHNEALATVDLLLVPTVGAVAVNAPPPEPELGRCWIVGSAPTGAWSGRAGALAGWTAGGWRFVAPREGLRVWSIADGCHARYVGGAWQVGRVAAAELRVGGIKVVGAQEPAIAAPVGGATVDVEARATVALVLAALRGHGLIAP